MDEYAVGHALVTLNHEGGCHIILSNISEETKTFTKGTEIAQFTIMNSNDYNEIKQVHPIAAECIAAVAPHVNMGKQDFSIVTRLAQETDKKTNAQMAKLAEEVRELTEQYEGKLAENFTSTGHDIVDYRPLEGATNEVWFATPENTTNPENLDHFNRRVYELIMDCKDKEKLDPTKSPEMRKEFLDMFEWEGTQFNAEQREHINELLVKYHGIFARHRFDIGENNEFKVKLTPTHDDLVYKKSPPTPVHIKEDLKVELALLQYYGILRTLPYSKYSSPIFAQRKPNGKMRILVNLRRINHILRHDYDENNFPIPSMDEANHHMANKYFFSKLACSQAYHVVQMADERSVQLLAFNFESRTFAYQRLAQGLNRSATAFSSFMRKYLETDIAADRCATFMDDVCTATRTFQEHVDALDHVFASLKRSGLRLTVKKCEFGVPEIKYLGWTISKAGQGVQQEKITKFLATLRMPRSTKQIQKMIGFMNYFKNYIPRLAEKLLPFYRMLQKGEKFQVTTEHKQMLQILKEDLKLAMERTMRLPLAGKQYVIMSDASDFAAGYVLMIEDYTQEQSKNRNTYAPIAFGSQKFSPGTIQTHNSYQGVLGSFTFAFENFAHMLWGVTRKPVVVFTDNKALSAFLQSRTIPASLCKYVDRLLQFRFVLAHVAGENNPAANYLSRMYLNPHLTMELEIGATIPVHQVEVRLEPQIQTEIPIPNEDGTPPTPTPPESPKPQREEDEDIPALIASLVPKTQRVLQHSRPHYIKWTN